jgi:hypothetical protein
MKSLLTTRADPGPVTVHASIASIAELYAAASAMEIADHSALEGLGDSSPVNIVTTAGAMRRLVAALGKARELPNV